MKPITRIKTFFPPLVFCGALLAVSIGRAQTDVVTPTTVYSFPGGGSMGESPESPLVQATDGNFYGTTFTGLPASQGLIYRLSPAGDFAVIHSFGNNASGDAQSPVNGLVQGNDGSLYGVTPNGGSSTQSGGDNGAIYKVTLTGVESVVYSFGIGNPTVAANHPLVQATDGNFYGPAGTTTGPAFIYKLTPAGVLSVFYTFTGAHGSNELIQGSDGNLYGVTTDGLVFRLALDGTFSTVGTLQLGTYGAVNSGLIQGKDGNFYGTATDGGAYRGGLIYKMTPAGVQTTLYDFTAGDDGSYPNRLMQASDGNFYGTTAFKDFNSPFYGTIFQLTSGGTFTTLYHFPSTTTNGSGKDPEAPLIQGSDGYLYGTTSGGGAGDDGTVFRLALPTAAHPAFFTGETALSNGVYYLAFPNGDYFGYYSYLTDPHYIFHFDLGYEYVFDAADGKSGVYLYDFKSNGFFYTSPNFPFPYLYDFTLNTVLYYYPDPNNAGHYNTDGYRFFYRFDNGQIIVK